MKPSRTLLYRRSRDTRFLARTGLGIAMVSVVIGFVISALTSRSNTTSFIDRMAEMPVDPELVPEDLPLYELTFDDWASYLRSPQLSARSPAGSSDEAPPEGTEKASNPLDTVLGEIESSHRLEEAERELLLSFARGMIGGEADVEQAAAELHRATEITPPLPHSAELLGDVRSRAGNWNGAIDAYQLEVERFPDTADRPIHLLTLLLKREGRSDEITELLDRPEFRSRLSTGDQIDHAIETRDYLGLLFLTLKHDLKLDDSWLMALSLFAAAIWFIIITQYAGQWRTRMGWYLAAVILGYLSASFTLYAVLIQEKILHFVHDPSANLVDQLLYCIAGIGLREETLKLLLFLPLVPFLARSRQDEIDALVCAGLVGLGFALNENAGYVTRGGEFETWGRFITANFFHIALTGVAGLSLVRCWRRPKQQWDNFLYDFLIVVAAHGVYDAFLLIPQLEGYSIVSLVIFAVICYLYLDQAMNLMRPQNSMTISPLAVFVLGSALLMGVVLWFACWAVPFRIALSQYSAGLGSMVPIAFIFISRLRSL